MPRSIGQRPAWYIGLLIALPAILGAAVSGLIALDTVDPRQRAVGVVQLSEIAGNAASGQLSPYAADLEAALESAPVRAQVREALGPEGAPSAVEVDRRSDASRVSISLEAGGQEEARTALLAAGRAGYRALVEQQVQLLEVRERAALARLRSLDEQVAAARVALEAAPPAEVPSARSALQRSERLRSIAVEDLSRVQGQAAVIEELRAGAPTTTAVVVQSVEPVSRLPQVLPIVAAGLVAGAVPGAALAASLRRRERSAARGGAEPRSTGEVETSDTSLTSSAGERGRTLSTPTGTPREAPSEATAS